MLALSSLAVAGETKAVDKAEAKAEKSAEKSAEGPSDGDIQDLEKAVWEAYKKKDADAFAKSFAPNYQGVYAEGTESVKEELADMKKSEIKSYSLSDVKVVRPTRTSALITYKVDLSGSYDGKDMSGSYNTASLWVKRGDKWLGILHTQSKQPAKK
jgi:ketosteroid isomerase-like protein